jgi:hypothetical protein
MAEINVTLVEESPVINVTQQDDAPEIHVQLIGSGPAGPRGPEGIQGPQGSQGIQGVQGPAGQNGADGTDGQDGVSPTISSESITGGHRLTIVDANGTTTVDVMDGQNGQDGAPGQDGRDGTVTWRTSVEPRYLSTNPISYGFYLTDLVGPSGAEPKAGDCIYYSTYYYFIAVINGTPQTAWCAGRTDIKGDPGTNGNDVAWFTYGTSTSAQIEAAYQAGKVCAVNYNDRIYVLSRKTSAPAYVFGSVTSTAVYQIKCDSDTWTNADRSVPAASSATPSALGTPAAGTGTTFARADHVHAMPSASDVGAVASNQGSGNAGKFLSVANDGTVTPVSLPLYNGGVS